MPTTTPNLDLASGMATDDYVQPSQWNRIADSLDRLDEFFQKITADGAFGGWEITEDKTVAAGEGNIDGKWCRTAEESAISGLANGAVNHVFGRAGAQAAPDGTPSFLANTSGTKQAGDVYLGTLTLDGSGEVTAYDSSVVGVDRNCCLIEIGSVAGSGNVGPVPAGQSVTVTVDHSASRTFQVPGAIEFSVDGADLTFEVQYHWAGGWFSVKVANGGIEPRAGTYVYERKGLV